MPIRQPPQGDTSGIFWNAGDGVRRIEHASVVGKPGTAQHQARMEAAVNAALATIIKLDAVPADDPARLADPKADHFHWGKADGTRDEAVSAASGYLIARPVTMRIIAWDGAAYVCETRRPLSTLV